jgi:hypothetical protein
MTYNQALSLWRSPLDSTAVVAAKLLALAQPLSTISPTEDFSATEVCTQPWNHISSESIRDV